MNGSTTTVRKVVAEGQPYVRVGDDVVLTLWECEACGGRCIDRDFYTLGESGRPTCECGETAKELLGVFVRQMGFLQSLGENAGCDEASTWVAPSEEDE